MGDLWLQSSDGNLHQLTNDVFLEIDPAFSPDEDFVVFASDRAGDMDLWRLALDSNELTQLTTEPGKSYRPTVSPDGARVAYLQTRGFGPWSESSLVVLPLDSGAHPRLLADGLGAASAPVWDPDGRGLIVEAMRTDPRTGGMTAGVFNVDLGSGTVRRIPSDSEPSARQRSEQEARFTEPVIDWMPAEPEHHYAVQVDRLFDGARTQYRRHMDIHVRNGRIADVVARGLSPLPEMVIDARDYTIIPGLMDIHAHQSSLGGERLGRIWLGYGITTVREVNSEPGDGMERREAWASSKRQGPRLLLTSPAIESSGIPGTSESARSYDVLELYAAQPERFTGTRFVEAMALGLPVFSDSLFPAARFGINGLEHIGGRTERPYGLERSLLDRTYQDVMGILAQTRTAVAPTLAAFGGFSGLTTTQRLWSDDPAYTEFFHGYERAAWQSSQAGIEHLGNLQETVAELVRAGGRVTTGSDAPTVPYGIGLHAELALLEEAGLANDQVLRLATAGAALALGLERDLGTLEVGKLADFVVLSGDPLTRITDTLRIVAIVKNGVWLERQELLAPP